jgi:hypothetical protein
MFVMLNAVLQEVAIAGEFCAATDETRKAVKTPRIVEQKFKLKASDAYGSTRLCSKRPVQQKLLAKHRERGLRQMRKPAI